MSLQAVDNQYDSLSNLSHQKALSITHLNLNLSELEHKSFPILMTTLTALKSLKIIKDCSPVSNIFSIMKGSLLTNILSNTKNVCLPSTLTSLDIGSENGLPISTIDSLTDQCINVVHYRGSCLPHHLSKLQYLFMDSVYWDKKLMGKVYSGLKELRLQKISYQNFEAITTQFTTIRKISSNDRENFWQSKVAAEYEETFIDKKENSLQFIEIGVSPKDFSKFCVPPPIIATQICA